MTEATHRDYRVSVAHKHQEPINRVVRARSAREAAMVVLSTPEIVSLFGGCLPLWLAEPVYNKENLDLLLGH